MTRRQRRSLTPELKIEASRHMRTCLYGEFQDSEDFEVGFVDVTDELDDYMSEFHKLRWLSFMTKMSVPSMSTL
ncbi:MAG: hypothetical protein C9355_11755 [Thalassolituus maritimus]|uniref:Uncharacterized protein n=1 Tax=Thalassolituus maritimus TaxID=484498 RepID=A0A1N7JWY9_9GAMM|nr:hypothetical protein [Thalassolituus maritimus]TPD53379.1 MAG: hypothetical protein C9355_11755 [Thalassolituus maritimus]SIS53714.1 hypothetical protein SAMN05421686_102224 [Thalassolituus maritimus]